MMGFRKVPLWLLYSPVISGLTSFQRDFVMFSQLARDARNCLPYDSALLRSVVFPGRPFVGLKEIAAARDHLVASGVFLHKATQRKEWLEIAPEYRNNDGENETSFGEEENSPEQAELKLGPQLIHNPQPAENRRKKSKANESRASATRKLCQGRREEEADEFGKYIVSALDKSPPAHPAKFARDEDTRPDDDLWADLCKLLGMVEMTANGALWERRINTSRRAILHAVEDFKNKSPEERAKYNPGAYITAAYESELRKAS